jgi:hypothetical protein
VGVGLAAFGISWWGHEIPASLCYGKHQHPVLLLRANDLAFRAENLSHDGLTTARAKALISPHRLSSSLLSTAPFEDGKLSVVLPDPSWKPLREKAAQAALILSIWIAKLS